MLIARNRQPGGKIGPDVNPATVATTMREINEVGRTAFFVNQMRAEEMDRAAPLYVDCFSKIFCNHVTEEMVQTMYKVLPDRGHWMALRTHYFDRVIKDAIRDEGVRQVVILGSGLDCRPLRLYEAGVRYFEVDQPKILDYKTRKLKEAGYAAYPSAVLRVEYPPGYLGIDLVSELEVLGLDPRVPTLYLWEGNTMYLPTDAATELLKTLLVRTPDALFAFDAMTPRIANPKGVVDTGDASMDRALRGIFDGLSAGKPIWVGGWDVDATATGLGYEIVAVGAGDELMREYRCTSNICDDVFDGDTYMAEIYTKLSKEYKFYVVRKVGTRPRRSPRRRCEKSTRSDAQLFS